MVGLFTIDISLYSLLQNFVRGRSGVTRASAYEGGLWASYDIAAARRGQQGDALHEQYALLILPWRDGLHIRSAQHVVQGICPNARKLAGLGRLTVWLYSLSPAAGGCTKHRPDIVKPDRPDWTDSTEDPSALCWTLDLPRLARFSIRQSPSTVLFRNMRICLPLPLHI